MDLGKDEEIMMNYVGVRKIGGNEITIYTHLAVLFVISLFTMNHINCYLLSVYKEGKSDIFCVMFR